MDKGFYTANLSPEIESKLTEVDALQKQIWSYQKDATKAHLWPTVQEKLRMEWVHHSNAIEGGTLSLGETIFFLQHGMTVEGKPFKDFLDARNHAQALDILYEYISEGRGISERLIKEINALLLHGIRSTPSLDQFGNRVEKPATPGEYKKLPNTVLQTDGSIHEYVDPLQVPSEMQTLCKWVNENIDKQHPVIVGALAHYNMVRIHPFDDGNGRGARILMNTILIKKRFPPAIIAIEKRREYISAIVAADEEELTPFLTFIANSLLATQTSILNTFDKGKNKGN